MGKTEHDIMRIAMETLEGHQRAIMGNMTVEVYKPGDVTVLARYLIYYHLLAVSTRFLVMLLCLAVCYKHLFWSALC